MNPNIEKWIVKNYTELRTIAKKITKDSDWTDDLLQDVLLQLYEKKEIKLKSLDDNSIKYYIVAVLKINWYSKTSPFFRKVRMESSKYTELYDMIEVPDDCVFDDHRLMELIENEWTETSWFHKIIFEKYMILGSLKKVSKDTTIPLSSVARYIKETKITIKNNTIIKFNREQFSKQKIQKKDSKRCKERNISTRDEITDSNIGRNGGIYNGKETRN